MIWGRAGIGKSVLCQYLATQWTGINEQKQCSWGKQFKAVFWIRLREVAAEFNTSSAQEGELIIDILLKYCLKDYISKFAGSDLKTKKRIDLGNWLEHNKNEILFILDGYDEIADNFSNTLGDFFDTIYQIFSHVLITSRPLIIERLGNQPVKFDRELECLGFTHENIEKFVDGYLTTCKKTTEAPALLDFLKTHLSLWGTAHIPINLELICWCWEQGRMEHPSGSLLTLTQLYQEIIRRLQRRPDDKNKQHDKYPQLQQYYQVQNSSATATDISLTLADIAENFLADVAYHALFKATSSSPDILLKGPFIQTCLDRFKLTRYQQTDTKQPLTESLLLTACSHWLGFLKNTQSGGLRVQDQTYYFIHFSFQEFFAARYVQKQLLKPQTDPAFQAMQSLISQQKYQPAYQLTWWFTAGLLYQQQKEYPAQRQGLENFYRALLAEPRDWIGAHHLGLLAHCLDECAADSTISFLEKLIQQQGDYLAAWLDKYDWLEALLLRCPNLLAATIITYKLVSLIQARNMFESATDLLLKNTRLSIHHLDVLIGLLRTTTLYYGQKKRLAVSLAQRPSLSDNQCNELLVLLHESTLDSEQKEWLAVSLAQRSSLIDSQFKELVALLHNTTLDSRQKERLAKSLAQRPSLSDSQCNELFALLRNTILGSELKERLAVSLAQRPSLSDNQCNELLVLLHESTLNSRQKGSLAESLAQRPSLSNSQCNELFALLRNTILGSELKEWLAVSLAQRPSLSDSQFEKLVALLRESTLNSRQKGSLAESLAQRPSLSDNQLKELVVLLRESTPDSKLKGSLAISLANHPSLSDNQLKELVTLLRESTLDSGQKEWLVTKLAEHPSLSTTQITDLLMVVSQDLNLKLNLRQNDAMVTTLFTNPTTFKVLEQLPSLSWFWTEIYNNFLKDQRLLMPVINTNDHVQGLKNVSNQQSVNIMSITENPFRTIALELNYPTSLYDDTVEQYFVSSSLQSVAPSNRAIEVKTVETPAIPTHLSTNRSQIMPLVTTLKHIKPLNPLEKFQRLAQGGFTWPKVLRGGVFDIGLDDNTRESCKEAINSLVESDEHVTGSRDILDNQIYELALHRLMNDEKSLKQYEYKPNPERELSGFRYYTREVQTKGNLRPLFRVEVKAPGSRDLTSDIDTSLRVEVLVDQNDLQSLSHLNWPSLFEVKELPKNKESLARLLEASLVYYFSVINVEQLGITSALSRDSNVYVSSFLDAYMYPAFKELLPPSELIKKLNELEVLKDISTIEQALNSTLEKERDKKGDEVIKNIEQSYQQAKAKKHTQELGASLVSLRECFRDNHAWQKELAKINKDKWFKANAEVGEIVSQGFTLANDWVAYKSTSIDECQHIQQIYQDASQKAGQVALSEGDKKEDKEAFIQTLLYAKHLYTAIELREAIDREKENQQVANTKLASALQTLEQTQKDVIDFKDEYQDAKDKNKSAVVMSSRKRDLEETIKAYQDAKKAFHIALTTYQAAYSSYYKSLLTYQENMMKSQLFALEGYVNFSAQYHVVRWDMLKENVSIEKRWIMLCSALQNIGFWMLHGEKFREAEVPFEESFYRLAKYIQRVGDVLVGKPTAKSIIKDSNDITTASQLLPRIAMFKSTDAEQRHQGLSKEEFCERFTDGQEILDHLQVCLKLLKEVKKNEKIPVHLKGKHTWLFLVREALQKSSNPKHQAKFLLDDEDLISLVKDKLLKELKIKETYAFHLENQLTQLIADLIQHTFSVKLSQPAEVNIAWGYSLKK